MRHFKNTVAVALAVLILSSCGGGGGGGGGSSTPAASTSSTGSSSGSGTGSGSTGGGSTGTPPATPQTTISSFAPTSALPGTTVTVTGTGFSGVTGLSVGGVATPFTLVSDTQLTFKVTSTTVSGAIAVTGTGISAETVGTFGVLNEPLITSIVDQGYPSSSSTLTCIEAGSILVISGTNLQEVQSLTVNGVNLPFQFGDGTLSVEVSSTAVPVGVLAMVDTAGNTLATNFQLGSLAYPVIASLSPGEGAPGQPVTITGQYLAGITTATFATNYYDHSTYVTSPTTLNPDGTLSTTVPANLPVGSDIVMLSSPCTSSPLPQAISVIPATTASLQSATPDGAPLNFVSINVIGTHLDQVTAVTVNGVPALNFQFSPTFGSFNTQLNASGNVVLTTPAQTVSAGQLTGSIATSVHLAQVFDRATTDSNLRLTPGRSSMLRVYMSTPAASVSSPTLQAQVSNASGTVLGTLPLVGPATLPTTTIDGSVLSTTFNALIPGSWIAPGMKIQITGTAAGFVPINLAITPSVGQPTQIHLVLVPLDIGGVLPVMPSAADVEAALSRNYPYAASNISVTVRAPLTVTGLSTLSSSADMSDVLQQIETVREAESATSFYYGVFSTAIDGVGVTGGTQVGVGYVTTTSQPSTWATSAVGWDSPGTAGGVDGASDPFASAVSNSLNTMLHELGHNHGRMHTPCATPPLTISNIDPNYPYAGGLMGPQILYDSDYLGTDSGIVAPPIINGFAMDDVMGYCNGSWLSDYNYNGAQLFAEAHTAAATGGTSGTPTADADSSTRAFATRGYITLSGEITPAGVTFSPARVSMQGVASKLPNSSDMLFISTARGEQFEVPVQAIEVADAAPGTFHFFVTIRHPGPITDVALKHNGRAVSLAANGRSARIVRVLPGATGSAAAQWSFSGNSLSVIWDAQSEGYLTATHIAANGTTRVLAQHLEGGHAVINLQGLPAGGQLELSLSSAFNGRVVQIKR